MHEQLDPAEISDVLCLEPTHTQRAGDLASAATGRRRKYSGWFLESAEHVDSRDSRDHFAWLLTHISGKGEKLKELLSRGYNVDICCRWDSASGHGGPNMDPDQMIQLGSLGIDVWFDIYFDGHPESDAKQFIQADAASRRGLTQVLGAMGKIIAGAVTAGVLALAVWAAWAISGDRAQSSAFELVVTGQDRAQAIALLGQPDHVEPSWPGFTAYASGPCAAPCYERLWWEGRLMPRGFEAWSVELDPTGRVLHKAHWVSP